MSRSVIVPAGDEMKKAKSLVMARSEGGEFTAMDRKVFNILLSNAYRTLKTATKHRIALTELAHNVGQPRADRVKESLERLWSYKIALDYTEEDGEVRTLRAHYISYEFSNIENSILTYAFDPLIVDHIGEPKLFALFSKDTMKKFSFHMSGKLYETCMMYVNRNMPDFKFDLAGLQQFFEVDGAYIARFDRFRERVIEKAVEEVNKYGEVNVSVDYERAGRGNKVVSATFKTSRKSTVGTAAATEAMPRISGRRTPRDDATVDMFDMRTDAEARTKPKLREDTLMLAKRLIGNEGVLDTFLEDWFKTNAVTSFGTNPDEAFLSWLQIQLESRKSEILQDIDVDAIYEGMMSDD